MKNHENILKTSLQPCNEPIDIRRGGWQHKLLIRSILATYFPICFLFVSCGGGSASFSGDERREAESIVRAVRGSDSLAVLQKRLEGEGNRLGSVVALRELGRRLRNESRFEEALGSHSKGLRQAEALGDTLEWVQALNNIGTDYRRMGVLDVAQEYHYRALKLSEECADTSSDARKNRVVSLNGLGNIYMTLGNYERADSALRMALEGERQLHSALGQAINYANLGSIYEHRGQTDSAWAYYRRSMQLNTEAGSTLGISLCHTYFGSLYEKAKEYGKATAEYEEAYRMMKTSKDDWHALNSLIALAGIHNETGNDAKAMEYLGKARVMAERIRSNEHLAEIHTLYYKRYKRLGDYRAALSAYEQAIDKKNNILDMEKVNRIQNTSLNIERKQQERNMNEARMRLEQERSVRHTGYAIFALVLFVLTGVLATFFYIQRMQRRNHLALKRLTAMRENFFTNITHEFRTPLTVILGLSHDLQASDSEDVRSKARTIERQGNGLLTLINQLLDISKIKSEVGDADWCQGEITTQLTMIVETYRDYACSRNIDLQFFAKDKVVMDFVPDYVNKVVNNLLSNALKFTPEHGRVRLSSWRDGDRLHIDVADTGCGMDKETLARVFEPFYQGKGETQHVGTGVGLALVKQIVDAVEGTITVESEVGKGTRFRISVPIHNDSRRRIAEESAAAGAANTPLLPETENPPTDNEGADDQCRVLVIEDNSDIAAYIGSHLMDRYAVSYADNGVEGMKKAYDLVPDLIITDLMMPGMDGLEVCRELRGNEVTDHIPIIVVTARITEEERIRGLEAGADAYLAKPFNTDELRTRVEKLLERNHRLRDKFGGGSDGGTDKGSSLTDAERRFLAKTVDLIYQLMDKRCLDVNSLAEKLCMSPRQLHRKLVAITGDSPATYMLRVKMQRARHLLETKPGLTIEEIAERCGFDHAPNFYSAFKKLYGITPMDYRREPTA